MVRIVFQDGTVTNWSNWLTFPSDGYGEITVVGPFLLRDVSRVEVNPVELRKVGRLIPEKEIDHSDELRDALTKFRIHFNENENDGFFSVSCETHR